MTAALACRSWSPSTPNKSSTKSECMHTTTQHGPGSGRRTPCSTGKGVEGAPQGATRRGRGQIEGNAPCHRLIKSGIRSNLNINWRDLHRAASGLTSVVTEHAPPGLPGQASTMCPTTGVTEHHSSSFILWGWFPTLSCVQARSSSTHEMLCVRLLYRHYYLGFRLCVRIFQLLMPSKCYGYIDLRISTITTYTIAGIGGPRSLPG
jgi:hypothetical protein